MHTKWCVISGPPCSGKTTLVSELETLGYPVVHEVARSLIEANLQRDITIQDIQARKANLQHEILRQKLAIERHLPENRLIFFDRGIPDSIAYFKLAGLDPRQVVSAAHRFRYERVFFLEPVAYRKDSVRLEEVSTAATLGESLERSYMLVGYKPVRIPCMNTEKRIARIFDHVP